MPACRICVEKGLSTSCIWARRGERDTENRFHPDWLAALHALIDEAEASRGPAALVTAGDGKFYSTGADLEWGAANPDHIDRYLSEVQGLLARILTLPMPTVAAVNGHAFGAGAFLTAAHDHRVMRADRGYICFPESPWVRITLAARSN